MTAIHERRPRDMGFQPMHERVDKMNAYQSGWSKLSVAIFHSPPRFISHLPKTASGELMRV